MIRTVALVDPERKVKKNLGWSVAMVVSALLALSVVRPSLAQTSDPNNVTEAVWRKQDVIFVYRSGTTYYNCSALQDKLRVILMQIGARHDVIVQPHACLDVAGIVHFQVTLHSPVPATEQNVKALTTYDSQDVLAARVRGEQLFTADELPRFAAEWRTVSFARDRKLRLDAADCELVQQLRRQVLSKLAVKVTHEAHCSIMSRNLGPPRLTVSALVALPSPDNVH
jgi:hypothetical protein